MLGHIYPSYRQRRSFKKYYYTLFIAFIFLLWQSGTLPTLHEENLNFDDPSHQIARRIPPESDTAHDKFSEPPGALHVAKSFGHHVHNSPINVEGHEVSRATPSPTPHTTPAVNDAAVSKLPAFVHEADSEYHEVDGIDRIDVHTDDNIEHAVRLTHPDDDAEQFDSEHSNLAGNGQIRLGTNVGVDEELNAGRPSQAQLSESQEEDTDADEPVESHDDDMQFPIQPLKGMTPWSDTYSFPSWDECESVKEKADNLPDMLYVPFEQSVKDVLLEGWEDEWIAKARYTGPKLQEPKIDFVYNCEQSHLDKYVNIVC